MRSKGPYAFVCRAVWRRYKPAYTWIVTNKVAFNDKSDGIPYYDRYVSRLNIPLHCSLVKAKGDSNYETIINNAYQIAKFVERNTNLKMTELAADFIRD